MVKRFLLGVGLLFGSAEVSAEGLVGDGVHDDTAAIQAMLDSGRSLVYLPPPPKEYVISRTLKIGSRTELRLDRLTRIRLAPDSNCPMLQNRDYYYGTNVDIVVTGGVWDFDNPHQEPNPYKMKRATVKLPHPEKEFWDPDNFLPDWNLGVLMRFSGVRHLEVHDLTLQNPTLYGLAINRAEYFTVDHVYFDYNRWNPLPINMDGVHLDSNCRFGRIAHVRGNTYDDMVALNTNDWWDKGPITDIVIEDIYADAGFRAVRLLSKSPSAPVKRVVIRDVRGRYYRDVIGFTRYYEGGDARGLIDDVVVENVFASKDPPPEFRKEMTVSPLIWFQGGLDVGRVSIRNISREETKWDRPTFQIERGVKVKDLIVRDVKMVNRIGQPIPFFECNGLVENPVFENLRFEGEWTRTTWSTGQSDKGGGE